MRWDLVVNTMTLCALRDREIHVHAGGEAHRPLVDVRDVAVAHRIAVEDDVAPGVYNLTHERVASQSGIEGYTIGCLALWIAHVVERNGCPSVNVRGDWSKEEGRSYDICGAKLRSEFGWSPQYGVVHSVEQILQVYSSNPEILWDSQNIGWMKML